MIILLRLAKRCKDTKANKNLFKVTISLPLRLFKYPRLTNSRKNSNQLPAFSTKTPLNPIQRHCLEKLTSKPRKKATLAKTNPNNIRSKSILKTSPKNKTFKPKFSPPLGPPLLILTFATSLLSKQTPNRTGKKPSNAKNTLISRENFRILSKA